MIVRTQLQREFHGGLAILRFAGHFETALEFENGFQSLTHERLVFGQQNPDGFHQAMTGIRASMTVPPVPAGATVNVPPSPSTRSRKPRKP